MNWRSRLWKFAAGAAAALLVVVVAGVILLQTGWFRDYVRRQIISHTEDATGGKVNVGAFNFDLWSLHATLTGLVIHGTEPAGTTPFLRVAKVEIDFRLLPGFSHFYGISYLGVDRPRVNVIESADGSTNIPSPKQHSQSETNPLQKVVDLAVQRFQLTNGLITVESRKQALDIRGNNMVARLSYDPVHSSYQGRISLQPVYVLQDRNTPVDFTVTLPVTLQRNRIQIRNGAISTPASTIGLNVSIDNMRNPKLSGHVSGSVALADLRKLTNVPVAADTRGLPPELRFDVDASASNNIIDVSSLRAAWGQSDLQASGLLKNPNGGKPLEFSAQLALGQLSKLLNVSAKLTGVLIVSGSASLYSADRYLVTGDVNTPDLSFETKGQRIAGIGIMSAFRLDPQMLDLTGLRVSAAGGSFEGNAALQNFAQYKVNGNLRGVNLHDALRLLGEQLPYNGRVSGPVSLEGDIKVPGAKSLSAEARLRALPAPGGIPVSGQLNAAFNGAAGTVSLSGAHIDLPHTNITVNGSTGNVVTRGNVLHISVTTADLNDLLAAASIQGPIPIALDGGKLTFQGTLSGGLTSPRVAGNLIMTRFKVEGRFFNDLNADLRATTSQASIANATLTRDSMRMQLTASVGLNHWSAPSYEPVSVEISIVNGDFADVIALAGRQINGCSGTLNAAAHIFGTLGNPEGTANLQVANGTIEGEPFSQLQARLDLTNQQMSVPAAYIEGKAGRLNLTAEYRHPRDRSTTGQLEAHLQSTPIDLGEIREVAQHAPVSGVVQVDADVTGTITGTPGAEFQLTGVNGDLSGRGLKLQGLDYGALSATARTKAQTVTYSLTDNWQEGSIRVTGSTSLVRHYPTNADANLRNISIDHVLVPAGVRNVPLHGYLSGTAHFDGTVANPQGGVDLDLSRAAIYDEPIENVRARAVWLPGSIEVSRLEVVSAPGSITMRGRYDHPPGDLQQGTARFDVSSSPIALNRIRDIQKTVPGFGGTVQIHANGTTRVSPAAPRILLTSLDAGLTARNIQARGSNLGGLTFTAQTNNRAQLSFALDSDLGGSSIRGSGSAALAGNYPVNARLTFANVSYSRLRSLFGVALNSTATPRGFDAVTDGQINVDGPVLNTDQLRGSLQLTKLNIATTPAPGAGKPITISNQGPLSATLDHGVVRIQSVHMTGPDTNITAGGSASLSGQRLDLTLNANVNLAMLPSFYPAVYSSGKVVVTATIQGSASTPLIDGQLALNNAAFNYTGITNGISDANGVIAFNGSNAIIRKLTAQSGGGQVVLTGFAGYTNGLRFGIEASATGVRVRPQEGVSVTMAAALRLTGTSQNSVVAGNVTIAQFTYNPKSDIGSILSRATPAVGSSPTGPPVLDNMRLEIRVRSSTGVAVQASLAQNLQADVDLRVRGTVAQPAVLGRIAINEGKLVFFGVSYTVNNGVVGFYNPVRVEPVLDISLETQAQGVHVTVRVTGPIDDMKLSYTSDPPLQFQEIISLLAVGQTPTSDPTLLASQPQMPQQSFQQMGESAIVTQAVADPLAERLSRVFGVTQLKVAPAFQSGTQLPTARVTVQQQVSSNITFTYTSALNDPNGLIVSIEWAFSPQYSAVATRDQNGIFSVNLFYKRHFR